MYSDDAAADLVELDRLKQGAEIAFAKTFIALALDNLKEDRPYDVGGKDLQQYAILRRAIDEDAALFQLLGRFTVTNDTRGNPLVVGIRRVLKNDSLAAQPIDGAVDISRR